MHISKHISGWGARLSGILVSGAGSLVPATCLTCDRIVVEQGGCCPSCWNEMHFIKPPICPVMGTPFPVDLGEGVQSLEAIANAPPFERLRAVVLYGKRARQLVTQLKFSDRTDLAPWMAKWMQVSGKELLNECDVVVPVPLHRNRLLKRRYNQSAELARNVALASDAIYRPQAMQRRRKTVQQTGLSEKQRQRNVSGAFLVPDDEQISIAGKRVLLIDDVYTTGATAMAAARCLLRAKAKSVDVLVFAKVEIDHD